WLRVGERQGSRLLSGKSRAVVRAGLVVEDSATILEGVRKLIRKRLLLRSGRVNRGEDALIRCIRIGTRQHVRSLGRQGVRDILGLRVVLGRRAGKVFQRGQDRLGEPGQGSLVRLRLSGLLCILRGKQGRDNLRGSLPRVRIEVRSTDSA